jgi:hypothetical protein
MINYTLPITDMNILLSIIYNTSYNIVNTISIFWLWIVNISKL